MNPSTSVFSSGNTPDAPRSDQPALLAALADAFKSVNYTLDGVADLLGPSAYAALGRDQIIPALLATERTSGSDQAGLRGLTVLVRLWLLAVPQAVADVDAALPGPSANGLAELGLVSIADGVVTAAVDVRPYGWDANPDGSGGAELWVASDLAAHQQPGVLRHDHVLGIGQASTTLVQTTIRPHAKRALDLGTGCGIQTFHLLHHCEHVTATDISERALAFTRFNLVLNAAALEVDPNNLEARISLRLGSLLEPVEGERFDLVVSNPPFVITPRTKGESAADQFTYRDGGLPGDQIVSSLVKSLGSVLEPGGTAQMLGNWEITAGAQWKDRPASWLEGSGLDVWFIQREQVGPEQYAETWLQDASESRDPNHYKEAYAAYLEDFASRNVEGIGFGMIWLRRPAGSQGTISRFEEITYPIEQPIGPHLGAAIARADWLSANQLNEAHLLVAEDVTEERHQRPGAEHPGVILLRQGAGLRRTNLLSSELAGFVSACDGDLSVNQIITALEALLGGEEGFDAEAFTSTLFHEVGNLVLDGFLVPDEPGKSP
ncbi:MULTISPECIES: methyltransferase [Paenarthrobacter]|uniref:Methyltransferase n=1 Tax=Paenarthrobacter ureafaciens TaxID=37931 RepID=A0AAX3EG08_PAEUR|nr:MULTISPECIES: methyltransferase [Paenarthrobacter]NKR11808.1 SAM-dependent methyltransferase [Arthrobacter sp. M5]NKR16847.1 SAM-dependent methyltransferase [Arthrobacter sp. M6]OEH60492.1 SAM-dependent methyltransferase [Arthrobacter sp. D4]OEH61108.1 SAM-dependent methyltransferase [Arthrobacter sp. D2]MDO5865978.1 methyltransferase [Paenarthrobacter sp. SD-2]